MAYLEEQRMVHRDLAARNVLVQTSSKVKIADFGLSKCLEVGESGYKAGKGKVPVRWLAPESLRKREFSHKSDVWAYGELCPGMLSLHSTKCTSTGMCLSGILCCTSH